MRSPRVARRGTTAIDRSSNARMASAAVVAAPPIPIAVVTAADDLQIRRYLSRRDPRLAPIIKETGRCRLPDSRTHQPFVSLVRALTSQQLSTKAAATIFGRVVELVGGPEGLTAAHLLTTDPARLRAAGLSGQKVSYVLDLAARVDDGRLELDGLRARSDAEVLEAITAVKGFGRWSAEMFLMFQLNRADIFPLGDLGIVKGMQVLLGTKRRPALSTMERAAELWRPYRSVAAWYLWRLVEQRAAGAELGRPVGGTKPLGAGARAKLVVTKPTRIVRRGNVRGPGAV